MPERGYHQIDYAAAHALWDHLSPEKTIGDTPGKFIFRGQADARWGLTPSVLRPESPVQRFLVKGMLTHETQIFGEMLLLEKFLEHCDALSLPVPNDGPELRSRLSTNREGGLFLKYSWTWPAAEITGLLALAQHHTVPTRLLDWTRRAYVGAYFAAESAVRRAERGLIPEQVAIWALDTTHIHALPVLKELSMSGLYPRVRLVTTPGAVSRNLAAQSGLFTVVLGGLVTRNAPLQTTALEDEFKSSATSPLWKLTLPFTECERLMHLCRLHSISAASLFPHYDGAGAAVLEVARTWKPLPP